MEVGDEKSGKTSRCHEKNLDTLNVKKTVGTSRRSSYPLATISSGEKTREVVLAHLDRDPGRK